jgi:hypothetical protein
VPYILVLLRRGPNAADEDSHEPECVEWRLVGVEPDAIDRSAVV